MISVLIVKTSSLGDVIHTLPALTDAKTALGDIQFDWLIEENFAEIPVWHPSLRTCIPVAIRRWRKHIFKTLFKGECKGEFKAFKRHLQAQNYDVIIDAQGLLKSAWLTSMAKGKRYGLDKQSAREPLAAQFYQYPQNITKNQHAVERVRQLFAQSLGYTLNDLPLDYGLTINAEPKRKQSILFLHATTWASKHWPESYWIELADDVTEYGYRLLLPWGNESEYQRAIKIQHDCKHKDSVEVLDKMNLNELAVIIASVEAVVAVDTGLAHLAAALNTPTIALYGPTSPALTGTYGKHQIHLQPEINCAPCFKKQCHRPLKSDARTPSCFADITPERVMASLIPLLTLKA